MSPEARQTSDKKRLDALVSQGKITQAQEDAIIAELATLRAKYPVDPNATPEQRKTQMTNIQNDIKSWAKINGIDPTYIMPYGQGRGIGVGRRGGMMRGNEGKEPTGTPEKGE